MKTHRMGRSTDNRNAHAAMIVRGRASLSRGALHGPDVMLSGRKARRALGLDRAQADRLKAAARSQAAGSGASRVGIRMDLRTREVLGLDMS